jgi:hypothetical protein
VPGYTAVLDSDEQHPLLAAAASVTTVISSNLRMTHLTGKTGTASPLCRG